MLYNQGKKEVGIGDDAVASSVTFCVERNYEVKNITASSAENILCFVPGRNTLMEHYVVEGENDRIAGYIGHDIVFPYLTEKSINNVVVTSAGFFEYRVVSYCIQLRNVGKQKDVAGSYRIFDCYNNPSPGNYLLASNGSSFLLSHNKDYFRFLRSQDIAQYQYFESGHVNELENSKFHLHHKVNEHRFSCSCGSYGTKYDGTDNIRNLADFEAENRLLCMQQVDQSYCSKVMFLDLQPDNHIIVNVSVVYEVLSDLTDVTRFKKYRRVDHHFVNGGGIAVGNAVTPVSEVRPLNTSNDVYNDAMKPTRLFDDEDEDDPETPGGDSEMTEAQKEAAARAYGQQLGEAVDELRDHGDPRPLIELGIDTAEIEVVNWLGDKPKVRKWIDDHADEHIQKYFKTAHDDAQYLPDWQDPKAYHAFADEYEKDVIDDEDKDMDRFKDNFVVEAQNENIDSSVHPSYNVDFNNRRMFESDEDMYSELVYRSMLRHNNNNY